MAEKISFCCAECGHKMMLPAAYVGRRGECPKCGHVERIAAAPIEAPPPLKLTPEVLSSSSPAKPSWQQQWVFAVGGAVVASVVLLLIFWGLSDGEPKSTENQTVATKPKVDDQPSNSPVTAGEDIAPSKQVVDVGEAQAITEFRRGLELFNSEGEYASAVSFFTKSLRLDPSLAISRFYRGKAYLELNDFDEAIADFTRVINSDTDNAEAIYLLGDAYAGASKLGRSVSCYKQALKLRPDFVQAHTHMAFILRRLGQIQGAVEHFERSIKLDATNVHALIGLSQIRSTHPDAAVRNAAQALKLAENAFKYTQGTNPQVLMALGDAFASNGQFDKAIQAGEAAVQLMGGGLQAEGIRQRLAFYRQKRPYIEQPENLLGETGEATQSVQSPQEAVAFFEKRGAKITTDESGRVVLAELASAKITDADLVHIKWLTGLQNLTLPEQVTDAGLAHLKGLRNMESMMVRRTYTEAGLAQLNELPNLQVFYLDGPKVTDASLVHLKVLTNLVSLFTERTQITDAGLVHLKKLTRLKILMLNRNQITDSGLVHLNGLRRLESLTLHGPQITNTGLVHLRGLTGLEYLDLGVAEATDAGLEHLKGLTNLTELYLQGPGFTAAGVARLQQQLPRCTIKTRKRDIIPAIYWHLLED